jgi:hypothetical protein
MNDDDKPEESESPMMGQMIKAFGLPWPRKPLSMHKGGKGGKGAGKGRSRHARPKGISKKNWFA